ncbi:MAG TPA: hypothetical protein VED46_12425 [Alphaproteobacteria bacterium]|nr:hypothetical protein [Alphaproteobacteria bacterium]
MKAPALRSTRGRFRGQIALPAFTTAVLAYTLNPRLSQVRPIFRSVQSADDYYRILAPSGRKVDIWQTEYLHVLEGDNPVFEWTKSTALRPYLDVLDEPDRSAFLAAYATRVSDAYPKQPDGRTLLPFNRIFLIAQV